MVEFRDRLLELMSYFNISQADLVRRTGLKKTTVCTYVSGKRIPKQDTIDLLHQTYGVSIQWLLGYDYPMFENYTSERKSKALKREMLHEKSSPQTEDFDFGYTEEETKRILEQDKIDVAVEIQKAHDEARAINKLEKLTQITSALANMSDEDFEMVYKLAIRLSK